MGQSESGSIGFWIDEDEEDNDARGLLLLAGVDGEEHGEAGAASKILRSSEESRASW